MENRKKWRSHMRRERQLFNQKPDGQVVACSPVRPAALGRCRRDSEGQYKRMADLAKKCGRQYAVIDDEAHSSLSQKQALKNWSPDIGPKAKETMSTRSKYGLGRTSILAPPPDWDGLIIPERRGGH